MTVISDQAIAKRRYWIGEIRNLSGRFIDDTNKMQLELSEEMHSLGPSNLIDHLRLCGNIPEEFAHDSSEEKLYSKYTDSLLSIAYQTMGLKSIVLTERADAADVEAFGKNFSFVADAKAFRLSRTAKNQKDFKVQAMHGWKKGKPHAMVVCPIYQLPSKNSQIYQQASSNNVCIFTYSHLSLLVNFALEEGEDRAEELLNEIFLTVETLNPSKSSLAYWLSINQMILRFSDSLRELWRIEKIASSESIAIAKELDLTYLAAVRERFMRMSHEDAIGELMRISKVESKINTITSIRDNGLFNIQ